MTLIQKRIIRELEKQAKDLAFALEQDEVGIARVRTAQVLHARLRQLVECFDIEIDDDGWRPT